MTNHFYCYAECRSAERRCGESRGPEAVSGLTALSLIELKRLRKEKKSWGDVINKDVSLKALLLVIEAFEN
jgi:hypothetical protein